MSNQTFIIDSRLISFITAIRGKIIRRPYGSTPQIRTLLDSFQVAFMKIGLITLRMPVSVYSRFPIPLLMLIWMCSCTVFTKTDTALRIFLMKFIGKCTYLFYGIIIPSVIAIIGINVSNQVGRSFGKHGSQCAGTSRIFLMYQLIQSLNQWNRIRTFPVVYLIGNSPHHYGWMIIQLTNQTSQSVFTIYCKFLCIFYLINNRSLRPTNYSQRIQVTIGKITVLIMR